MTSPLCNLRDFLVTRSVDGYLVGGYLRDSLLGLSSRDIDVAVDGNSMDLARELADELGGAYVPLTEAHQVARIVLPGDDGLDWRIDISRLQDSIQDDLARRDFTVDALALPLDEWCSLEWWQKTIDPFDGKEDLTSRRIKAVSCSVFSEDPLRLLRGVRLSASLDFNIEESTTQLIAQEAPLISSVPPERVRDEFLAILSLNGAKNHLKTLDRLGLLCYLVPELEASLGVEQPKEHYWDVFEHSLNAVEGVEEVTGRSSSERTIVSLPWPEEMADYMAQQVSDGHSRRTLIKLAALLHDVAKPQTKTVDSSGRTRFLGHQTLGASVSRDLLNRLRISAKGVRMVCDIVEHHLRPTHMSQGEELPTARAIYRYFRDVGEVAVDTLYLSLADHLAARGPQLDMDEWRHHVKIITHILEIGACQQEPDKMPRLITGHDLMSEFGLRPGPEIGAFLEQAREAQAAGEIRTREDTLAWVRDRLAGREV